MKKEWFNRLKIIHGVPVIFFEGLSELLYWMNHVNIKIEDIPKESGTAWLMGGMEDNSIRYYISIDLAEEGEPINAHGMIAFPVTIRDHLICENLEKMTYQLAKDCNAKRF